MMTGTKFDIEKFDGINDFGLWQVRMKALLEQQGLAAALEELPAATIVAYNNVIQRIDLVQSEHIDEFHKLVGDLATIDTAISDEDQSLLLLTSLPLSYDNFVETLLYGRDTLKLKDVLVTLNSRELQKMMEAKGDGGEGLYVRRRSGQIDIVNGIIIRNLKVLSGMKIRYSIDFGANGYDSADVMMAMSVEEMQNLISLGTLEKEGFTLKMQSGKIKVIKGSLVVLSGTRRANCVYTLDDQAVTSKILKGRKQLGEYQTGWKIKTGNVLDFCNQRSTQQCMKSGVAKHLGVAGIQQNGLVKETNMTLLAKVRCFLIQSSMSKVLWAEDTAMSTYLVDKVVLYRNVGFNESREYKKTFIGSGVGTGSVQVLQRVEFEVEPQEDHTFKVEPHGNVNHVAGSQEVQTQDLIYYHLARDREQHSTHELFNYREDSNEFAFAIAEAKKIYANESLTFNNTVAYEVISKWKAGLKDDMDAQSHVYLLSNSCKKCSDDNNVYYSEYTLGVELFEEVDISFLSIKVVKVCLIKDMGCMLWHEDDRYPSKVDDWFELSADDGEYVGKVKVLRVLEMMEQDSEACIYGTLMSVDTNDIFSNNEFPILDVGRKIISKDNGRI
ncbi:hypothetical protein Tco_0381829 [Tanacetum coccineum]